MKSRRVRRQITSVIMSALCVLSVVVTLIPLAFILAFVVLRGITALNFDFFTQIPKPVGETGGGMANGIVGSLILCGLGALLAIPIGMMAGMYVAQSAGSRSANIVRFAADTLNGI